MEHIEKSRIKVIPNILTSCSYERKVKISYNVERDPESEEVLMNLHKKFL